MARRGRFGRAGTTQNLTMLVYQIQKEQMDKELRLIEEAYRANMKAGTYVTQFNGQNVDSEYVIDYYRSMLAGFPSGSTEYQTILSKLQTFEEESRTDIQDLVIDAMTKGRKIDFGLLGSNFANKGIAEVELVDVRNWANEEIQDMISDGNTVQADKLKGAVFVAGFNVENDGKSSALDREEISYGSYAKWLKGQMESALESGLTKSSDAYLSIEKAHAQAVKNAKVDGQNRALEGYEKQIDNSVGKVDKAAKAIIDNYVANGDGIFNDTLNNIFATLSGEDANTPYYSAIKQLALQKSGDIPGGYEAVLGAAGDGMETLFGSAVSEMNTSLNGILSAGFGAAGDANAKLLLGKVQGLVANGNIFVKASGIEFNAGRGSNVMEQLETGLKGAGAVFQTDDSGVRTFIGGHPDAVEAELNKLGQEINDIPGAEEYSWLSDLGRKRISLELLDPIFQDFDQDGSGYVELTEFEDGFTDAKLNHRDYNDAVGRMNTLLEQQYSPSATLRPSAAVGALIDMAWSKAAVKAGSIIIAEPNGSVKVSDWGDRNPAGITPEIMPSVNTINGKQSITYVKPLEVTQGDQGNTADPGIFGGLTVRVYRLPGNLGSLDNVGQTDAMVTVQGTMDDGTGTRTRTFQIPFDQFEQYSRERGVELDSLGLTSPGDAATSVKVSFTDPGKTSNSSNAWVNMFNPNSSFSIFKQTNTDPTSDNFGKLIVSGSASKSVDNYRFYGIVGSDSMVKSTLQSAFTDRNSIVAEATRIAGNKGKEAFDMEDIQEAGIKLVVGDTAGILSQTTIRQMMLQNPEVLANIQRNFSDIRPAQARPDTNRNVVTGTSVYGAYNPPSKDTSAPESPYLRTQADTQADTGVSPFLASAFRNKPEMAQKKPDPIRQRELPQIKPIGAGGKLTAATIKTVTPRTVTVNPTAASVTGTATATQGISGTGYAQRRRI
jgi:hypothetical protein